MVLINISNSKIYTTDELPKNVRDYHQPYFLCLSRKENISVGGQITKLCKPELYQSYCNFDSKRLAFKIFCQRPSDCPEVSTNLFLKNGVYSAEFDIRYVQRALCDLAVEKDWWIFDTKGKKQKINILTYDIEQMPNSDAIDIIGYSNFEITIKSSKDLSTEDFKFEIIDAPDWKDIKVHQLISEDTREEIKNLAEFIKLVQNHHIIAGHNILQYDNLRIYDRLKYFIENKKSFSGSDSKRIELFENFIRDYTYNTNLFIFGKQQRAVIFYPNSFDTNFATRKFLRYLDNFGLKGTPTENSLIYYLKERLGIKIPNRVYLKYTDLDFNEKTYEYNRHDVIEETGLTLHLIQQGLPLAFISNFPFEHLLPLGQIALWDYMAMLRAKREKKIMPLSATPIKICESLSRLFPDRILLDKNEISQKVRNIRDAKSDLIKIGKYGTEMPNFVQYPKLILEYEKAVGGRPLKPQDLHSQYILWYNVIHADVNAMYPTILKSENACGDTVKLSSIKDKPDDYIWLRHIPKEYLKIMQTKEDEKLTEGEGLLIGINVSKKTGLVAKALSGIIMMIAKTKKEKAMAVGEEKKIKQSIYDSLKAIRNASTHGILLARTKSCRQFNLFAGDLITTRSQVILNDIFCACKKKSYRVLYGDTDSTFIGTSKSAYRSPKLISALGLKKRKAKYDDISNTKDVKKTLIRSREKWRKRLGKGFGLDIEIHPAAIFTKHKNYILIDLDDDGKIKFDFVGNNFGASDKPNIAINTLKRIMKKVIRENLEWETEEEAVYKLKSSIRETSGEVIKALNIDKMNLSDLILTQTVRNPKSYKYGNQYYKRSKAVEEIIKSKITTSVKINFIISKNHIPGMAKSSKTAIKPLSFMYPVEYLSDLKEIDLDWYRNMVINYVATAFDLSAKDISLAPNMKLDDFLEKFGEEESISDWLTK